MTIIKNEISAAGCRLFNLTNINLIIGRNGAGKSRFLRGLESSFGGNHGEINIRYISPERGGTFQKEGNVENNLSSNSDWLRHMWSKNQWVNFKQAASTHFREVETIYLRRLESNKDIRSNFERNFRNDKVDKVNKLLTNVSIEQHGSNFIFRDYAGIEIHPEQISSGESETVALAAEIFYFFETLDLERFNVLLIDEPDVHLHPDLQARLARFIIGELDELSNDMRERTIICISTHSTPLISALSRSQYTSVGTKHFAEEVVQLKPIEKQLKKISPFFGHPLSLSLNDDILLILEGEDDERVWQQAARTAKGRIKLFPVLASSVNQQTELEKFCNTFMAALYDSPVAYSLRDGDGKFGDLEPVGCVIRFRLNCYAIENILLSDECLSAFGGSWDDLKLRINDWLKNKENEGHKDQDQMRKLLLSEDRLRNEKIKDIRNLIGALFNSRKPWEVVVGQEIGKLAVSPLLDEEKSTTSLINFVGLVTLQKLLGHTIV